MSTSGQKRALAKAAQTSQQPADRRYTKKELIDGFPPPGPAMAPVDQKLGAFGLLLGTWNGHGNTMLAVPSKEGLFRGINHPRTNETITYSATAPAPDRGGFNQPDVNLSGVRYHHQVVDAKTTEPLHDEMGFWLNVPGTVSPKQPPSIIRELSIPHGNAAILFGTATEHKGAYKFPPYHAIPSPKENFPDPSLYDTDNTGDVNRELNEAQKGLEYLKTYVLGVATRTPVDIVNIPFLTQQAASTSATATFVVSVVKKPGGDPFFMLQYSQVILIQFPAVKDGPMISWPHTAVATMVKTS